MAPIEWRPAPGFTDYEVSNDGQIRRVYYKFRKPQNTKGYRRVKLSQDGRKQYAAIHRLVAGAFIGPCPPTLQVNHKNGVRSDNRVENLEYVTAQGNQRHSVDVLGKRPQQGSRYGRSKLTEAEVLRIRVMRAEGMTYEQISRHFDIKPANIWHICSGRTWRHIQNGPHVSSNHE